jgi:hypothetical protein
MLRERPLVLIFCTSVYLTDGFCRGQGVGYVVGVQHLVSIGVAHPRREVSALRWQVSLPARFVHKLIILSKLCVFFSQIF